MRGKTRLERATRRVGLLLVAVVAAVFAGTCLSACAAAPDIRPTVVRLDCPDDSGWGSGVRVSDREVLTAWHVAECFPGAKREGTRDVGWVEKNGEPGTPVFRAPVLGEHIRCYGFPMDNVFGGTRGLTVTEGVVANVDAENEAPYVHVTCPIQPGNSGGPAVGDDGAVVGITVGANPTKHGGPQPGYYLMEPAPFDRAAAREAAQ